MSDTELFPDSSESDVNLAKGRRPVQFYGTVERTQYMKDKENQNTLNRMAEVRRQEAEIARQKLEMQRKKQQQQKEQELIDKNLEEYLRKKKEIEELMKAKELAEQEIGRAHLAAEESQKQKLEREAYEREKRQKFAVAAQERSKTAIAYQRETEEAINGPRRQLMEKRKQVLEDEAENAHKLAAKYRENEKNKPEQVDDFISYQTFDKNVSRKVYKSKITDFSKTHLHNPVVVNHMNEEGGQPSGFEAAKIEAEKAETRKGEFMTTQDDQRKKSLDRWKKALEKENDKKYMQSFENEMEKLQKAKNEMKISQGKQYPEMQAKPATNLQNKDRVQKEAEKVFEDIFIKKGNKSFKSEGNGQSERELPPKTSFNKTKAQSSFRNTSKKWEKAPSVGSPLSGFGKQSPRTNEDDFEQQTLRSNQEASGTKRSTSRQSNKDEAKSSQKDFFKREKNKESISEGTHSPEKNVQDNYDDEEEESRENRYEKYSKNQQKNVSSNTLKNETKKEPYLYQEKSWKMNQPRSEEESPERSPDYKNNKDLDRSEDEEENDKLRPKGEDVNQSASLKDKSKSFVTTSFGQKEQSGNFLETSNLRPANLQRPFNYSYQQPEFEKVGPSANDGNKAEVPSPYFTSYGNKSSKLSQSQAERPSNRKDEFEENRSKDELGESGHSKSYEPDNEIKSYIQEQEQFLKKLDNDRKKLDEKLRASQNNAIISFGSESLNKKPQEKADASAKDKSKGSKFQELAKEPSPEDEAIEELQRKADDLLSRFMNPSKSSYYPVSDNDTHSEQSPERFDQSEGLKSYKPRYFMESQSSVGMNHETKQSRTPEKGSRLEAKRGFSSPSDLDYSISDRDRSEKKSLAHTMEMNDDYRNDYRNENVISFGQRPKTATETFGRKKQDLEGMNRNYNKKEEQKKAWKMEFQFEDNGKKNKEENEEREERDEEIRQGQEPSLAEMFKQKKKRMIEKYEHQKEIEKTEPKDLKPTRTKEEILKQRKAMMEYRGPRLQHSKSENAQKSDNDRNKSESLQNPNMLNNPFSKDKKSQKEPNPELLDRLAFGKKSKVSKKEMLSLTSKNYEQLPEIKKKKEQEKEREEIKKRKENAKKFAQKARSALQSKTQK